MNYLDQKECFKKVKNCQSCIVSLFRPVDNDFNIFVACTFSYIQLTATASRSPPPPQQQQQQQHVSNLVRSQYKVYPSL
jgi:hypothetical protein